MKRKHRSSSKRLRRRRRRKELERASLELSAVTAELEATRNILNEGINHDAARGRELTYKQHRWEKVREGREQVAKLSG